MIAHVSDFMYIVVFGYVCVSPIVGVVDLVYVGVNVIGLLASISVYMFIISKTFYLSVYVIAFAFIQYPVSPLCLRFRLRASVHLRI